MWKRKRQVLQNTLRICSLIRNYSIEHKRKFTVYGAMDEADKEKLFYIDPRETNEKELIPSIHDGQYILFYGKSG
jgi:hypothetical protein